MARPYLISGAIGSPYTRKMKALLLYRRIPYQFLGWDSAEAKALPAPPRPLMPCIWMPDAEGTYQATSDSTFQIRSLEERFKVRSAIPADPALAFLDYLIEDYADEWVTKQMFHYRWGIEENVEHASKMLPLWSLKIPDERVDAFRTTFSERQIERLSGVVTGSLEICGPIVEASYERLLTILAEHFRHHRFVMGDRPGTADFGLHGQLTQLVQVEPTSMALARAQAPRVMAWVDVADDLSGISVDADGWIRREQLGDSFREILAELGRTYAPFMVANGSAIAAGSDRTECLIDGQKYWQKSFSYQAKCLGWLREAYGTLGSEDRAFVDGVFKDTGAEALVAGA